MFVSVIKKISSKFIYLFLFLLPFTSSLMCRKSESKKNTTPDYITEIEEWRQKRMDVLLDEGWLTLVGLFWLQEGINTFGADPSNDIVFPNDKTPDFIGSFVRKDSTITVQILDRAIVLHQGEPVKTMELSSNDTDPTTISLGTLEWFIIRRGDRFGVRLRDLENKQLVEFRGFDFFPIDANWRIEAKFEPYDTPKLMSVPNVLGTVYQEVSPGQLVFEIAGKEFRLNPQGKMTDDRLWIIFSDATSGKSTYGGGRYLWMDIPKDEKGIIDFNQAYNPPCVFSNYATCPLPPEPNRLTIEVLAGEKYYDSGLH